MAEQVAESGHWYDREGNPAYTIIGKNGSERNTTLRDARKLKLLPSVTTIIRCAAAPGLQAWKDEQMIMACLTMPKIEGEPESDYIARIKRDAGEQALKARERGTLIHAYIQSGFEGKYLSADAIPFCDSAIKTVFEAVDWHDWTCEQSFATSRYGGKADLHTEDYLIDIKTTEKPMETVKLWDEHYVQLAAYREGLGIPKAKCGILYVNSIDAESRLIWAEEKELEKGLKMFNALLDYYYAKTGLEEDNGK